MRVRNRAIGFSILLVVAACGDAPLSDLGGRSSSWLGRDQSTTVASSPAVTERLTEPAIVAAWWNDGIGLVAPSSAEEALAAVVARRTGTDRFEQANRREIAKAVPGLRFPAEVPSRVEAITSQLHFAIRSDQLASDFVVAFGFWSTEPYARSRSVGQVGVMTVAIDIDGATVVAAGDMTCDRVDPDGTRLCTPLDLGRSLWALNDELGTTYVWFEEGFRYELFLRGTVDQSLVAVMVADTVPFEDVAFVDESTRVVGVTG